MAKLVLGIDLGGTDCKFGLMDETGHIVRKAKYPTRGELGPQGVLENMAENARKLMGDDVMRAVGLGVPGVMSSARGFVYEAPNLPGWVNVPVGAMLSQALGLSVAVNNDANAAAYGEFWAGAGRAVETMIMFTLGTGVGGGIILDGKLYTGPDDTAAELGHMCVKYDGPRCGCGAFGCLEALASATAVRRMVMEALAAGRSTRIEIPDNELELGAKAVADAAMAGDHGQRRRVNLRPRAPRSARPFLRQTVLPRANCPRRPGRRRRNRGSRRPGAKSRTRVTHHHRSKPDCTRSSFSTRPFRP
jgi:glucokinase